MYKSFFGMKIGIFFSSRYCRLQETDSEFFWKNKCKVIHKCFSFSDPSMLCVRTVIIGPTNKI